MGLDVGGYTLKPDWPKLGASLVIATTLIVAIRTAKWPLGGPEGANDFKVMDEITWAQLARRVLGELVAYQPDLFPHVSEPWCVPNDEETPK